MKFYFINDNDNDPYKGKFSINVPKILHQAYNFLHRLKWLAESNFYLSSLILIFHVLTFKALRLEINNLLNNLNNHFNAKNLVSP